MLIPKRAEGVEMRKVVRLLVLFPTVLLTGGCPQLTGTKWPVDVTDTTGTVSPDDVGTTLADLSGYWWFDSDGTLTIRNNWNQFLTGTYKFNGENGSFTARYDTTADSRSDGVEVHILISGTFELNLYWEMFTLKESLEGTGKYSSTYTASPTHQYSMSGDVEFAGTASLFSVLDVLGSLTEKR